MPKTLLTGANGFVAIWVVRTLLEKGYTVRGTVRSKGKGDYLKAYFEKYGDRLEIVVVEDIAQVPSTKPLKGCMQSSTQLRLSAMIRKSRKS